MRVKAVLSRGIQCCKVQRRHCGECSNPCLVPGKDKMRGNGHRNTQSQQGGSWASKHFILTLLPHSDVLVFPLANPNRSQQAREPLAAISQGREQSERCRVDLDRQMQGSSVYPQNCVTYCPTMAQLRISTQQMFVLERQVLRGYVLQYSVFYEHIQFATELIKSLSLQSHKQFKNTQSDKSFACEVKTVLSPMSCARQLCT